MLSSGARGHPVPTGIRTVSRCVSKRFRVALGAGAALLLSAAVVDAQLFKLTRDQVMEITADNPFERFPDGRPKIPDALLERAKGLSAEEVWAILPGKNYRNQWADGFELLHPGRRWRAAPSPRSSCRRGPTSWAR